MENLYRATLFSSPDACYTGAMEKDFRAVVLHGFTNEEALTIMRAVKALDIGIKPTAFATTTPTSLCWKVSDLIAHLAEEHAAMQEMRQIKKA